MKFLSFAFFDLDIERRGPNAFLFAVCMYVEDKFRVNLQHWNSESIYSIGIQSQFTALAVKDIFRVGSTK